ncbi:hypothetical protein Agub_g6570 [Astrephomene gubernaculifera]|uniref:Transmembrane protein n=1 Tax=Astrephomene gubernaculifera TaxID=47775 RepID=A0AAD3DQN2_9CHLO|nr:hypothetical protein Agub_g6570 [Astrephomene gubernaculifera]
MRQRPPTTEKFDVVDSLLGNNSKIETSAEPLDEQEQEAIIQEFEILAIQQHRTWRSVFGAGTVAAGLFFLYAAWRQKVEPYGVRYTGELRSVTGASTVTAVLALQGVSLLLAAAGLLVNLPPKAGAGQREAAGCLPFAVRQRLALWSGVLGAAGAGVYWAAALVRMVQLHGAQYGKRWELSWLPAGPLAACLVCCYVASSLYGTEREIQRLRSYRYRYKKL